MAKNKPNEEELDELREAFDYNDRDGDGTIQLDEFSAMLDELEAEMSEQRHRDRLQRHRHQRRRAHRLRGVRGLVGRGLAPTRWASATVSCSSAG